MGECRLLLFWRSAKNCKNYGTLKFLWTQDHMGLEISKHYSYYSFHLMSDKLYQDIGYHGGTQTITFVANRPSKNFVILWNFNMCVNGKPKMWNMWKTANRRAKRTKIWDLRYYVHIGRVLLMPDSLSLVWGHSVHFAKFPILRFSKHYSFNSFRQISTPSTVFVRFQPNSAQSIIIRG